MQPLGAQGRNPEAKSPTASFPWFIVFNPSTSLFGITESVMSVESIMFAESNGICTIIPWTLGFKFRWDMVFKSCSNIKGYSLNRWRGRWKLRERRDWMNLSLICSWWKTKMCGYNPNCFSCFHFHSYISIWIFSSTHLNNC